jgi:hypothetical protein
VLLRDGREAAADALDVLILHGNDPSAASVNAIASVREVGAQLAADDWLQTRRSIGGKMRHEARKGFLSERDAALWAEYRRRLERGEPERGLVRKITRMTQTSGNTLSEVPLE